MQPRVQDPTLRHHHDHPGQVDHGDAAQQVLPDPIVGDDDEEGLQDDTPRDQPAGPEVETSPSLEEHEEGHVDLNANVP